MNRWIFRAVLTLTLVSLTACKEKQTTQLERIQEKGELTVYTRLAPTTAYTGLSEGEYLGFEYHLAELYAEHLGVTLSLHVENDIGALFAKLKNGEADMVAAGISATELRKEFIQFSPSYHHITSKLIYKQGQRRPRDYNQVELPIHVIADSSHEASILEAKKDYPELTITRHSDKTPQDLMSDILDGTIEYAVVDSNELDMARQTQPELAVAFSVSKSIPLAWAFKRQDDHSLFATTLDFFSVLKSEGTLDTLIERYYGHMSKFDLVENRELLKAVDSRLSLYQDFFIQYAKEEGIDDWRLLAAMGYQESHWKPDARSPTGVRGLMMLTQATAKQVGIADRLDPEQSIKGGAKYLHSVLNKIPDRIQQPDRTWFALAGYNVGFGHLEDARRLAQQEGKDPDSWLVIKEFLPLLRKKKWYSKTRYGYARGDEPVSYVNNIRQYYQTLQTLFPQEKAASSVLDQEDTDLKTAQVDSKESSDTTEVRKADADASETEIEKEPTQ